MVLFLPLSLLIASPLVSAAISSSAGASTGGGSDAGNDSFISSTWYAGWHGTDFPPENVSWSKYSSVSYAFATTTPDFSVLSLADSDEQLLPQFVQAAHDNGVQALITIGGWSGSQYFSSAMATSDNRTSFTKAILDLVSKYDLDGVDFDWEYPNKQGIGCNTISSSDSSNLLSLLQEIRNNTAGQNLTLSTAVSLTPFAGSDGSPMSDVSQFADVLDYIEIMDYDVWGSWSTGVGPNAPLNDTCASSVDQQGSAVSAVSAWTSADFPKNQIVLGVASYGHSFSVPKSEALGSSGTLAAYPEFDASNQPDGDAWSGDSTFSPGSVDECGNAVVKSGIFDFWGMVSGGFLSQNGTAADGIEYRYDNCTQTPYVYNPDSQVMISYDDVTSFAAKGQFINDAGLAGFAMWEAGGDYGDILLNAILGAIDPDDC